MEEIAVCAATSTAMIANSRQPFEHTLHHCHPWTTFPVQQGRLLGALVVSEPDTITTTAYFAPAVLRLPSRRMELFQGHMGELPPLSSVLELMPVTQVIQQLALHRLTLSEWNLCLRQHLQLKPLVIQLQHHLTDRFGKRSLSRCRVISSPQLLQ